MAKTKQADFLDDLLALRGRLAAELEDPENYSVFVRSALLNIDGALSHLESARRQERSLER